MPSLPFPAPALRDDVVALRPCRAADIPAQLRAFGDPLFARFAPDFPDCLEHYEVLGPPDIEQRIGLTQGNIFQGETMPDQMWEHRLSSRTPIDGFYLCGAATHPGGSVIALNGRNAAMAVLADAVVASRAG